MLDDLKDAEMVIDYACEIKEECKDLSENFAKYASIRLNHFIDMHKFFVEKATKDNTKNYDDISNCLWDVTHDNMKEWYEHVEKKIKGY